jgi:hypothetical protein
MDTAAYQIDMATMLTPVGAQATGEDAANKVRLTPPEPRYSSYIYITANCRGTK